MICIDSEAFAYMNAAQFTKRFQLEMQKTTAASAATTSAATVPQGKCWCFTYFYEGEYEDGMPRPTRDRALEVLSDLSERANYLVWGDEVAPTTGQKHFQCYVQFETRVRRTQLQGWVPRTHWTLAKGSDTDNFIYCTKDGKYEEIGERRDTTGGKQGRDSEQLAWDIAKVAIQEGRLDDVESRIYIMHYGSLKSIMKDNMKMPADATDVTGLWIWGPPGTGKSRRAREQFPGAYFKLCNKWFDGYNPAVHKVVIMDDLDKNHSVLCYHLKIWADRYAFTAETKGGAMAIRPEKFVVTSNYSIEDVFGPDEEAIKAIRRRFTSIHMDRPFASLTDAASAQGTTGSSSARARLVMPEPGITMRPPSPTGTEDGNSAPTVSSAMKSISVATQRETTTPAQPIRPAVMGPPPKAKSITWIDLTLEEEDPPTSTPLISAGLVFDLDGPTQRLDFTQED